MAIIGAFPKALWERVQVEVPPFGKDHKPLFFEDKVVARFGAGATENFVKRGLPINMVGVVSRSKIVWTKQARFCATGKLIGGGDYMKLPPFEINRDLRDMIFDMLQDADRTLKFDTDMLLDMASALSGPDFCPNQEEYGKRYLLTQLLLN